MTDNRVSQTHSQATTKSSPKQNSTTASAGRTTDNQSRYKQPKPVRCRRDPSAAHPAEAIPPSGCNVTPEQAQARHRCGHSRGRRISEGSGHQHTELLLVPLPQPHSSLKHALLMCLTMKCETRLERTRLERGQNGDGKEKN